MGSWSADFFDHESEVSDDVRNEYVDYLQAGLTGKQATKRLREDFAHEIKSARRGRVFWMALAVIQWKYGRLEPGVKAQALRAIQDGGDVAAYPKAERLQRAKVLDRVRAKLVSPQPAEKRVRVVPPAKPLKKIDKLWQAGQVVAFRRASGRYALLLTEVVDKHTYIGEIPYFVLLDWRGAKLPSAERIAKLRACEYVVAVYPNQRGEPVPWDRVERLKSMRPVTGQAVKMSGGVFCEMGFDDARWDELDDALTAELE